MPTVDATDKFHGTLKYGFTNIPDKSRFSVRVVRPPSDAKERPGNLWGMRLGTAAPDNYFPAENGAIAEDGEIYIASFSEDDCKAKTSFKLRVGNVLEVVNGWDVKGKDVNKVNDYIKMAIKKCSATYPIDFKFRRHDYHAALEEIKLFVDEVKAMEEDEPKPENPPPVKMVSDMDEKQRRAAMRRACGALGVDPEQEYHIVNSIIEDVVNVSSSLSSNGWEAYVFDEVIWYWNTNKNDICAEHPTRLVCSAEVKELIAKSVFTCISIQRRWRNKIVKRVEETRLAEAKNAKEREEMDKKNAAEKAAKDKAEAEEQAKSKAEDERLEKEKKAIEAKEAKAAEEKKKKEAELKRIEDEKAKKKAAEAKKKVEAEKKKKEEEAKKE